MERTRLTYLLAFFSLLVIVRIGAANIPATNFWIGLDYYTAYGAADAMARGNNPYDPHFTDILTHDTGLPRIPGDILGGTPFWVWAHQSLRPFAPRTAAWIWFLLSCASMIAGLRATEVLLDGIFPKGATLRLRVGALAFLPVWGTVFIGQSTAIVFILWSLAALLATRRQSSIAACLYAVAGAIKVFPIVMLGWFFARREWRALLVGCSCFLLLQVPALIERPSIAAEFFHASAPFAFGLHDNETLAANQSIRAFFLRLSLPNVWSVHPFPAGVATTVAGFVIAACALVTVITIWRRASSRRPSIVASLVAFSIAASVSAPFLWHHVYLLLWPAYAFVLCLNLRYGIGCIALIAVQHVWDYIHPVWLCYIPPLSSLALGSALLCWFVLLRAADDRRWTEPTSRSPLPSRNLATARTS